VNNVKNIEERLKKSKKNIIIKGIVKKYCEGKLKRTIKGVKKNINLYLQINTL
jgi:tetrahydromethanopterin S-methyltransferase subunit A